MSLKENILDAQKDAMKARDSEKLATLRMLTSAIKNQEIEDSHELSDDSVQKVVMKQIKQLQDALSEFEKAGRDDLVSSTKKELEVLSAYMPKQFSDEDLRTLVKAQLEKLGVTSSKDVGRAMGAIMKEVGSAADGTRVRNTVMSLLEQ